MQRIRVLGLGFVLLLASFFPAVASAREYGATSGTVVVQYSDGGYYGGYYGYRDRDDYYRYYRRHRNRDAWHYRRYHHRRWHRWRHYDRDDYWR